MQPFCPTAMLLKMPTNTRRVGALTRMALLTLLIMFFGSNPKAKISQRSTTKPQNNKISQKDPHDLALHMTQKDPKNKDTHT